jgi:hypothetical protein
MTDQDALVNPRPAMPFDSLLAQSRDLFCAQLGQALTQMLDKADETLAAAINNIQDTEQRKINMEARDAVRSKRKRMAEQFRIEYLKEFELRSKRSGKTAQSFSELDLSTIQLDLVGDDDLKETLKVSDMANKLRRHSEEELVGLDQRVGVLLGDAHLTADDNPFCPQAICDAYQHACSLHEKVAVRMVLLKLFDDHLVGDVRAIYAAVNDLLVQNSILPKIRFGVARAQESSRDGSKDGSKDRSKPAVMGEPPGNSAPAAEQDFFATLQNMMANNPAPAPQVGAASAVGGAGIPGLPTLTGTSAMPGMPMTQTGAPAAVLQGAELMSLLTRAQHEQRQPAPSATQHAQHPQGEQATATTNVLRELKTTSLAAGMSQLDNMTLDIVAMLFDQLFDDPRIPIAVKGLIGRMQICILKVAIADKEFFSKKTHPARRMLDSLGEISLRLPADFGVANPLFASLETIIQDLLSRFEDNVDIFDQMRERLQHLVDDEDLRVARDTHVAAERIKQAETLGVSKVNAQSEVRARILGRNVPLLVRAFLMMEWVKVLLVVHVQRGPNSEIWKNALSVMDLLIWSVRTDHTPDERRELVDVIPGLRRRLIAGLKIGGVEDAVRERFFASLQTLHDQSLRAPAAPVPAAKSTTQSTTQPLEKTQRVPPTLRARPTLPAASTTQAPLADAPQADADLDFTQVIVVKNPFGDGKVEVDDLDFSNLTNTMSNTNTLGKGTDAEFLKQIKVGTWVEFHDQDKVQPAKLAYVSPLRNRFLFIDRLGKTVNEYSRAALAIQFNLGGIVIMEEVSLFERIMKGVVGKLAAAKEATKSAVSTLSKTGTIRTNV